MSTTSTQAIGIDLGTTFSVVAYLDRSGVPQTVMNSEGDLSTPSVVYFDDHEIVVGKEALKAAVYEPGAIIQHVKRDMGRPACRKAVRGTSFPPEVIQALILGKLHRDASTKLGAVGKAVVTVPAFFNEPRRKATMDAGRLAGLDVLDILNEPTAAAIAYGVKAGYVTEAGEAAKPETILVYDLGGGTFDVTLMHIQGRSIRRSRPTGMCNWGASIGTSESSTTSARRFATSTAWILAMNRSHCRRCSRKPRMPNARSARGPV